MQKRQAMIMVSLLLIICCGEGNKVNHPPIILSITCEPADPGLSSLVRLIADAADDDKDSLYFQWAADEGTWLNSITDRNEVGWITPFKAGNYIISLAITDIKDTIDTSLTISVSNQYCFKDDFSDSTISKTLWVCHPIVSNICSFDNGMVCTSTPTRNSCAPVGISFDIEKTLAFGDFYTISWSAMSDNPYGGQQEALIYILIDFPSGHQYRIETLDDEGDAFILAGIDIDILANGSSWLLFYNINPKYRIGISRYRIGYRPFETPSSYNDSNGAWNKYVISISKDVIEFFMNEEKVFTTPEYYNLKNIPIGTIALGSCGYQNINWCFDDVEICSEEETLRKYPAAPSSNIPDDYWDTFTPAGRMLEIK